MINETHNFPANGIITSDEVFATMNAVDRGNFCDSSPYMDSPQGIGYGVTISAPHMVKLCTKRVNQK